jgi:hypothetical protein
MLLPCQYAVSGPRLVSELALVAAILEDALRSVSRRDPYGPRRREFTEARAWLLDNDRTWPFAFRNVCDLLGVDAAALRESVRDHLGPPRKPTRCSSRFTLEEVPP